MKIKFIKTKKGKLLDANMDPNRTKKCWGIDKDGEFGCGTILHRAEEYINGKNVITPIEEQETLLGKTWINHWMLCPHADRFHKLFKNKKK